ncbi:MAG: urease accessory protein UreF [Betaproteobacteria bacterium]|jgi:urease accessory protein|nr:MAG: urease accessory protein UreF [Betaproteobacteria bacterium]
MDPEGLVRLLRIASPALPVGAFSYSQGLEWAVECGGVRDEDTALQWIGSLLSGNIARFELPMLAAFYRAWVSNVPELAADLNEEYLASRETAELRSESIQMGGALLAVLQSDEQHEEVVLDAVGTINDAVFPNVFAFAAVAWNLRLEDVLTTYAWSWLENQVAAAMKLVPVGQRAGQRLLARLGPSCVKAMRTAVSLPQEEWSNFAPLFAIASSRHETQYTRLFRS